MNKREMLQLEFAKRTYETIPTKEIAERVTEVERAIESNLTIWDDEVVYNKYKSLLKLSLSDRRLCIVYSIFNGSVAKTAVYFGVNRRTIQNNIVRIQEALGVC